jgi:DNA (cytosine-5)-methyltransferase 1
MLHVVPSDRLPRRYIIRRLTPLECCRLQGFPDWWIDGCEKYPVDQAWVYSGAMRFIDPTGEIVGSDSAKYKLWGNGMALPNMLFVMRRIAEREATV